MALCAVAIAAPDYPEGRLDFHTLTSLDPASLFNACRYAARLADSGCGPWGESNWATPRTERRKNILLLRSLIDEMSTFENLLLKEQPNLLLIGSMTIAMPGAIACAKRAKEMFGDQICVVLGGRHTSETIYFDTQPRNIVHHPGSPLRWMAEGRIEPIFDLVVSGDGEYVIPKIGEIVDYMDRKRKCAAYIQTELGELSQEPGRWIAGWVDSGRVFTIEGKGGWIDYNQLPPPCAMFGVRTSFGETFDNRLTAQVFSDGGRGCVYDCEFCSERCRITGPPAQMKTSAWRLFRQMASAVQVIREDSPMFGASAFVEDSTLLAGSQTALRQLVNLLEKAQLDLLFGGQFTIDQILNRTEILRDLKKVGFTYVFIGLETPNPQLIGGMSKDVQVKENWLGRAEKAFDILHSLGIKFGVSLLFGLGESKKSRVELFKQLEIWRNCYGFPDPISMNLGVQHPLCGLDGGMGYTYDKWGTPVGPFLDAFQAFGEASLIYPLAGQPPPTLEEVEEVREMYNQLCEYRHKINYHLCAA